MCNVQCAGCLQLRQVAGVGDVAVEPRQGLLAHYYRVKVTVTVLLYAVHVLRIISKNKQHSQPSQLHWNEYFSTLLCILLAQKMQRY